MSCTNCFNGCEIVSDRCVKYTGIDIPELGIQTGDTLSSVEQSITTYLVSVLDGSGVKIDLSNVTVCNIVQKYLPACSACTDVSIADIAKALIKSACDIQGQIDDIVADIVIINNQLDEIEANYTVQCLTNDTPSITPSSGTHNVLQATIDTLCALITSLPETYVSFDNVDNVIQAYLDSTGSTNLISDRMVPYAVVPYFGPLTNFGSSGAGLSVTPSGENWIKVNLCNGNNGTPDLRGRALTGAINNVPGPTITDPIIVPGGNNPNYTLNVAYGANQVGLEINQMPAHTHVATVTINDPGHTHDLSNIKNNNNNFGTNGFFDQSTGGSSSGLLTNSSETGLKGTGTGQNVFVTNAPQGENLPHANIQPVVACYYIQYIP